MTRLSTLAEHAADFAMIAVWCGAMWAIGGL